MISINGYIQQGCRWNSGSFRIHGNIVYTSRSLEQLAEVCGAPWRVYTFKSAHIKCTFKFWKFPILGCIGGTCAVRFAKCINNNLYSYFAVLHVGIGKSFPPCHQLVLSWTPWWMLKTRCFHDVTKLNEYTSTETWQFAWRNSIRRIVATIVWNIAITMKRYNQENVTIKKTLQSV